MAEALVQLRMPSETCSVAALPISSSLCQRSLCMTIEFHSAAAECGSACAFAAAFSRAPYTPARSSSAAARFICPLGLGCVQS